MANISSKAAGFLQNNKKFNGIEYNTNFDINTYEAFYRNLDPQIGRFLQIDPKLEKYEDWSPYTALNNNPIRFSDPLGDEIINGDQQRLTNAQQAMSEKNYKAENMKKSDFKTKAEFKEYKEISKELRNAQQAFNHTRDLIANFRAVDLEGFNQMNTLTYNDVSGTSHNLDVRVTKAEVKAADKAETQFGIDLKTGIITNDVLITTIDTYVSTNSNVLAHEFGHGVGIASNPVNYLKAFQADGLIDCQDPKNRNHTLTKNAMDMEQSYEKKLRARNRLR